MGEADLLAATISRRRKFKFIHGGIISTNDKVGERAGNGSVLDVLHGLFI